MAIEAIGVSALTWSAACPGRVDAGNGAVGSSHITMESIIRIDVSARDRSFCIKPNCGRRTGALAGPGTCARNLENREGAVDRSQVGVSQIVRVKIVSRNHSGWIDVGPKCTQAGARAGARFRTPYAPRAIICGARCTSRGARKG